MRHFDFNIAVWKYFVDRINNACQYLLDSRPTCGFKHHDRDATIRQILLIFQVLVRSHQNVEVEYIGLLQ